MALLPSPNEDLHMTATAIDNPLTSLRQLRNDLGVIFLERREVIDGALCAILAGEHVLLLGPPGTGKSAIVRAIAQAFTATYFERLLTKFTTPEELFGPFSLSALEQDRYARVTTGKLPEAQFAFTDEIWKANSAILNSLLTLVNERVFHNDGAPTRCPLISLFGASNELPEGKELEALFDRFLLRYDVHYLLRPTHFRAMVVAPDPELLMTYPLEVLTAAQGQVKAVKITDATVDSLLAIRDTCKAEGIEVSDRRWKRVLKLAQASAFLAGEKTTTPEDLLILADSLWREPKDRAKLARIVGQHADPVSAKAGEILDAARETAAKIAGLKNSGTDRREHTAQAAQALEDFMKQKKKLETLAESAGPRAKTTISDAAQEITQLHAELARSLSTTLGIGR
jgi:MoxR-like ATPase